MILSVDFGFGNVKAVTDGSRVIFRSIFAHSGNGEVFVSDPMRDSRVFSPQTVEDLAELYPVVVREAMRRVMVREVQTVACGLPLQSWVAARELRHVIAERIRSGVGVEDVRVYPQTASCAWLCEGDVLVIDIGFNTVISCLMRGREIFHSRTYYRHGAVVLAERVNSHIERILSLTGRTLSPGELDAVVMTGRFQSGLDVHDLSGFVHDARKRYIYETIHMVIKDIKVDLSGAVSFSNLLVVGGLAGDVKLHSERVNIMVPVDAIFANANAFLLRAREEDEVR